MPHFNRLGGNMDEANAECAAWDEDNAQAAYDADMKVLIQAVKDHAIANYNTGGWDMVVECMEDAEIAEEIAGCTTVEAAIAEVGKSASLYAERRQEAWAEGGLDHNGREPEEVTDISHSHCQCRDADDECDYCGYMSWMADMKEEGAVCEDGGYKSYSSRTKCVESRPVCFLSQDESDDDNIPF